VKKNLAELSASWSSEKIFQDGAKIVLCGKTNAGKSSLFNALLKEERAIVSGTEGTTRDWLESFADFGGIPVRLFDTAGIRETDDEIERRGVENAKSLSESADVIFYLIDAKKGMDDDDRNFMMQQKIPVVAVLNKCDEKSEIPQEEKKFWNPTILVSAKNSAGLDELVSEAKKIILCGREPSAEKIGLGSFRQKKSVEESLERIEHALKISRSGELGLDAVVQDLEDALDSLGEVTGEVSPDDVLENVFSRFCVGK
jgi:tRNA modification GTPase